MVAAIITTSPETAKTTTTTSSSLTSSIMNRPVLATIRKLSSRGKRSSKNNKTSSSSTLEAEAAAAAVAESIITTGGNSDSSTSLTIEEEEEPLPRRRRRCVRFQVDENDTIQPTSHHHYESVSSQQEKECMYCSTEEMQQIRNDAKEFASQHALEHQQEYRRCIERLFDSPLNQNFSRDNSSRAIKMSVEDAIQTLCELSEGRGLEMRMTKATIKHARFANKAILARYHSLKEEQSFQNPSSTAAVHRTKNVDTVLRLRCLQLNKCTRNWALALAKADEIEAFKIYNE